MVGDQGMGGNYDAQVIWQQYNPYPKVSGVMSITDEWVFVSPSAPDAEDPLNSDESITSKLRQLLFLFPGALEQIKSDGLTFTPLVTTGSQTGTITPQAFLQRQMMPGMVDMQRRRRNKRYVLAARIQGELKDDQASIQAAGKMLAQSDGVDADSLDSESDAGPELNTNPANPEPSDNDQATGGEQPPTDREQNAASGDVEKDGPAQDETQKHTKGKIDVVYVTDIDLLHRDFLSLRARPESEVNWRFDNVTFVLNVLDVLAGDARFVEVRKRETRYPTLQMVEARTAAAREQASEETENFKTEYDKAVADAGDRLKKPSKDLQQQIDKLQASAPGDPSAAKSLQASMTRLVVQQQIEQRRLDAETERLRRERDQNMKRIDRRLESQVREVQTWFKFWAVVLPIVPPLALGLVVFFRRRSRERESITVARRR